MEINHVDFKEQTSKRLPNPFILFCKKHRPIVKQKFPDIENRRITKILAEWWSSLEDDQKNVFNNIAADLKERYSSKETKDNTSINIPTNIIKKSNNLNAAIVLAAASPIAPCWQKNRSQTASSWQPSPLLAQQMQQEQLKRSQPASRNSSGSSSPEPNSKPCTATGNSITEAAPRKMFKQRYLANEKSSEGPAADSSDALVNGYSNDNGELKKSNTTSLSPKDPQDGCSSLGVKKSIDGFQSLRDAVWSCVAQTILMQKKEKSNDCNGNDQPMNLTNQCTIRGQTIIEHIIENMIDGQEQLGESFDSNKSSVPLNCPREAERIKEVIYQSLKDDIQMRSASNALDGSKGGSGNQRDSRDSKAEKDSANKNNEPSPVKKTTRNTETPLNLTTSQQLLVLPTQVQNPSSTIADNKSNAVTTASIDMNGSTSNNKTPGALSLVVGKKKFDLEKQLNAIPALNLEMFHNRIDGKRSSSQMEPSGDISGPKMSKLSSN